MADVIAPFVWMLAGLLVLAGAAKLRDPEPTAQALRAAGMTGGPMSVRLAGICELGVASWCVIASDSAAMAALAATYFVFAGVISRMRQAGVGDCGCFGARSFEPGAVHLALNAAAAAIAVVAVIVPPPDIGVLVDRPPLEAIALACGLVACVYLSYLAFTMLPSTWNAYEGHGGAR
jgi:hypothetical protein